MKKIISTLLIGIAIALFLPPACGREGPNAPPDTVPPTVTSTSPRYGEQDVPINTGISVVFSEEMNPLTINDQTLLLSRGATPVSGAVTYNAGTAHFSPDANLSANTLHTFSVTVGVTDAAGNAMVAPYFFTFTTGTRTVSGGTGGSTTHTITATAGANGSISPSGSVTVNDGASQSFTMTPNSGYHVSNVLVDGASAGAVSSYTFNTVTADHTIAAGFAANQTTHFTITASAGSNGTITPSGNVTVNQGASQSFTVSPNAGYHISDVSVDGTSIGAVANYTFNNVNANHTIKASFAGNTYTITATAGAGGSISCSPTQVNYGSDSVCKISSNQDYKIADVKVDGGSVGAVSSYTFNSVTQNHTIAASFKKR